MTGWLTLASGSDQGAFPAVVRCHGEYGRAGQRVDPLIDEDLGYTQLANSAPAFRTSMTKSSTSQLI